MVYNSLDLTGTYNPGTRLRTTRTVAAPTQCTSLNGTTQYWVKTSPNKLTFTDDFVVDAYVKLANYGSGDTNIISRYNGTSGWQFVIDSSGRVLLIGRNAGAANVSYVQSYQSIPLNKWTRVTAQLDMSTFTATTTTSYVMIDSIDVPATVIRSGTNPTTLIQAGNLEIGSGNAGAAGLFPGKIAQVAVYSAKVTQANILLTHSQGLLGTETNLASAYSFNGVTTDLNTTTPNDLSAGAGSPTATDADSPFGKQASGLISSTLDYGIVQSATFSTNTTLVVQVPEGCTIPTSGGVSAVAYSGLEAPYGFPGDRSKWFLESINRSDVSQTTPVANTWYNLNSFRITAPIGNWLASYEWAFGGYKLATTEVLFFSSLSTSASSNSDSLFQSNVNVGGASGTQVIRSSVFKSRPLALSAQTIHYAVFATSIASVNAIDFLGSTGAPGVIRLENPYV